MPQVIETRLANALFAQARMRGDLPELLAARMAPVGMGAAIGIKAIGPIADAFSAHYGGLWVGGRATLTPHALHFEPNAINRKLHADGDALRLDIPLAAIEAVETRFGWVTGIIDIAVEDSRFSIRCFRSKQFAASIRQALQDVRPSPRRQPGL